MTWTGRWVSEHTGLTLVDCAGGESARDLAGLALRRNSGRGHLLVSPVLGKHIPADPREVFDAAVRLGELVARRLNGASATVIGYAETATGLGHVVAGVCGSYFVHTTRRAVAGAVAVAAFDEEHSHAVRHLLLPEDPARLAERDTVVLVDDELSTGRTAMNTILELQAIRPRTRYVLASLVDVRGAGDRGLMDALATRLGARIEVVSLAQGQLMRAAGGSWPLADDRTGRSEPPHGVLDPPPRRIDSWPRAVRDGGRHGFDCSHRADAEAAAAACAVDVAAGGLGDRILVLATEELMYAPLLIAHELASLVEPAATVRFSSTTRSPVTAIDDPGYPVRTRLTFVAHDDPDEACGQRFAYNVAPAAGIERFTDIVVVVDDVGDTPSLHSCDGLLAALVPVCDRVHLVVIASFRPSMTPAVQ